jgi:hypothetical protein
MLNTIEVNKLNREICLKAIPYLLKEVEFDMVGNGEYHKVRLMGVEFNNMVTLTSDSGSTLITWPARRDGTSRLKIAI